MEVFVSRGQRERERYRERGWEGDRLSKKKQKVGQARRDRRLKRLSVLFTNKALQAKARHVIIILNSV